MQNLGGGKCGRERKTILTKAMCFLPRNELESTSDHHKGSEGFRILHVFVQYYGKISIGVGFLDTKFSISK